MNNREPFPPLFNRIQGASGILAVIGIIGCIFGEMTEGPKSFLHSYLFAYIFWICFSLGCFGFMLLQNMVRASWGFPLLRLFEAGAKTLPLMLILFLPIAMGIHYLYPWADAALVKSDKVVAQHALWMNLGGVTGGGFILRTVIYFLIWIGMTVYLTRSTAKQDETGDYRLSQARTNVSSPGFLLLGLTMTLSFTDWVMSLDKHWYSTIFGMWFFMASGLSAMILMALIVVPARGSGPFTEEVMTKSFLNDIGLFLIMFCMVWGYFTLSQFLIIWSGNLPEEIGYYLVRNSGGLLFVGAIRIIFQFFVPFLLLLSGRTKKTPAYLVSVAFLLLVMRVIDIYWTVVPAYRPVGAVHWMDFAALFGMGGLWLFSFVWLAKQRPLLTAYDGLRVGEALGHEHA